MGGLPNALAETMDRTVASGHVAILSSVWLVESMVHGSVAADIRSGD